MSILNETLPFRHSRVPTAAVLLAAAILISPSGLLAAESEGAKDLFYKQKANPTVVMNTGLQYWIELKRGGKTTSVSNKFSFKTGDSIRIHVIANTDAFAYIILKEGSQGEKSILFPDPQFHDDNKLKAARDYALPQNGFMTFDKNPGSEKLTLLLSRKPLEAEKFLNDKSKKRVFVAAREGAKDLIPGSVVMAYSGSNLSVPPAEQTAASSTKPEAASTSATATQKLNKPEKMKAADLEEAVTTLVQKNPGEVLAVDLDLLHLP